MKRVQRYGTTSAPRGGFGQPRPRDHELDTSFIRRPHHTDPRRLYSQTSTWRRTTSAGSSCSLANVNGALFLEAIEGSAVDMGYAQAKGRMMLGGSYPAEHAARPRREGRPPAADAAPHGLEQRVIRAAAELLERAAARGDPAEDMAAAFRAAAERAQR